MDIVFAYIVLFISFLCLVILLCSKVRPEDEKKAQQCYQKAWRLRYGGKIEESIDQYYIALDLDNEQREYYLALIDLLTEHERYQEADQLVNQYLWKHIDDKEGLRLKSISCFYLKNSRKSIKYYQKYLKRMEREANNPVDEMIRLQSYL